MKKLTLIGHYCATGGISIHLRRLEKLLKNTYKILIIDESRISDCDGSCYNLRNKKILTYLKIIWNSDIIHIHTSVPLLRFIHAILGRILLKKVIVTVHSLSTVQNKTDHFILKATLLLANKSVVVSEEIKTKLKYKNVDILPAFIPPNFKDEPDLPSDILTLLNNVENKKKVVSNAYRINFHNGNDLYGIDLLIDVARMCKKNNDNIFIIFVITSLEINENVYNEYYQTIIDEELIDYIKLIPFPISFVKLIANCDLVVRATNTDGDAITIREALFLGKPIIASDVVKRPEGTILFKNRHSDDLYLKITEILKNLPDIKGLSETDYLKVYNKIYL